MALDLSIGKLISIGIVAAVIVVVFIFMFNLPFTRWLSYIPGFGGLDGGGTDATCEGKSVDDYKNEMKTLIESEVKKTKDAIFTPAITSLFGEFSSCFPSKSEEFRKFIIMELTNALKKECSNLPQETLNKIRDYASNIDKNYEDKDKTKEIREACISLGENCIPYLESDIKHACTYAMKCGEDSSITLFYQTCNKDSNLNIDFCDSKDYSCCSDLASVGGKGCTYDYTCYYPYKTIELENMKIECIDGVWHEQSSLIEQGEECYDYNSLPDEREAYVKCKENDKCDVRATEVASSLGPKLLLCEPKGGGNEFFNCYTYKTCSACLHKITCELANMYDEFCKWDDGSDECIQIKKYEIPIRDMN